MQEYTLVLCKLPSRSHFMSAVILTEDYYRKIWRKKFFAENNEDAVAKGRAIFVASRKKWLTGWLLPSLPAKGSVESEAEYAAQLEEFKPITDFYRA